jgi:hypothetical protein
MASAKADAAALRARRPSSGDFQSLPKCVTPKLEADTLSSKVGRGVPYMHMLLENTIIPCEERS